MKKLFLLSLAAILVFAGCSMMGQGGKQTVVGTWAGNSPQLGTMVISFLDDGTTNVSISGGGMDMELEGKYEVNYDADPMTLDQFDFGDSMMGDMRYMSIFKFTDANTIVMAGNADTMGGRPTDFSGETVELKRAILQENGTFLYIK